MVPPKENLVVLAKEEGMAAKEAKTPDTPLGEYNTLEAEAI